VPDVSNLGKKSGRMISTFVPTAATVQLNDDSSYSLTLAADASLCFVGHVRLRVDEGMVVVGGHHITPQSGIVPLFSCAFDPGSLLSIHAPPDSVAPVHITLLPATSRLAHEVVSGVGSHGGIGAPSSPNTGVTEGVGAGVTIAPLIALSLPGFIPVWRSDHYAPLSFGARALQVASSVTSPNTPLLLCGARNAGKSTFARFLVNRLLNTHDSVAYLECDVGQCEFTPPGVVSLTVVCCNFLYSPSSHPCCHSLIPLLSPLLSFSFLNYLCSLS
jgi:hypothetical protein